MECLNLAALGVKQTKMDWNEIFPVRQHQSALLWKWQTQKKCSGFNTKAILVQAIRSYNAKAYLIISIRLLRKPISIITIQVYALTTDAENENESFYTITQKEIDHTPKQYMLVI